MFSFSAGKVMVGDPLTPDARIASLAARQHSLVIHAQALDGGLAPRSIDHRLATGRWERAHAGVYRIAGARPTWSHSVLAACLAAGEGTAASHRTAGVLWGLIERPGPLIEVTVPVGKHARGDGFVVHRTRVPFGPPVVVDDVPVTSPARTLLDLATTLPPGELEEALDKALRLRLVSLAEVRAVVEPLVGSGRKGVGRLRRLIDVRSSRGAAPDEVFETRFLKLIREEGLPEPVSQFEVRRGPHLVARVDFAYPAERIAIELDGYAEHSSRIAFERDRLRQNELQAAGFAVLRFTWGDLRRERNTLAAVKRLLWERGHPDVVSL